MTLYSVAPRVPKNHKDAWVANDLLVNGLPFWCYMFHNKHIEEKRSLSKIRCNKCNLCRYNVIVNDDN